MSSLAKVGETDLKWAPRKPTRPPPGLGHRPSRSPAPPAPPPPLQPRAGTAPSGSTPQTSGKGTKIWGRGLGAQIPDFPPVFRTSAELFYALSSKCQSSKITDRSNLSFPTVPHPPIPGLEMQRPWGWGKGEWEKTERASGS